MFSGCTAGGELFKQSLQKTAPKVEEVGPSYAPVSQSQIDPYGSVLTTIKGYPLYTYRKDKNGKSNCDADCAIAWPPLLVENEEDVSGAYGTTQRSNGTLQVTLNGQPLYTYTPDSPNKANGNGKNGDWELVVLE